MMNERGVTNERGPHGKQPEPEVLTVFRLLSSTQLRVRFLKTRCRVCLGVVACSMGAGGGAVFMHVTCRASSPSFLLFLHTVNEPPAGWLALRVCVAALGNDGVRTVWGVVMVVSIWPIRRKRRRKRKDRKTKSRFSAQTQETQC
ncbi:uncharacterized protein J3D65DRAFT_626556 [Phyllosticta citribraziliensis]|uniref:Transmembrane protein n=1 Tax=Phyllosticta citribraziliensis TaxID=989973 RepID=A0ABR1LMX8_9PEZI